MLLASIAAWVHNLSPFVIRFYDNVGIRYYGVAYVLGFVVGAWLLTRYAKAGRSPLAAERVWDLITFLMIGVYLGGRLGHFALYDGWKLMKEDPWSLLRVWEGGMAFHGGLAGVAVALWIFGRLTKIGFARLCDLVATLAPAGLLFGRIANFINGELWGKQSQVPWAMIFPQSAWPGTPIDQIAPRHPSQLYEAALEGLLLLALVQWRFWRTNAARSPGRITGEFLIVYAVLRAFCEIFREPDAGMTSILGLSRGTFYSLICAAIGLVFVWRSLRLSSVSQETDTKKPGPPS